MKYLLLVVVLAVFATVNSHPLERHARSAEEEEPELCLTDYSLAQIKSIRQSIDLGGGNETDKFGLCFLKSIQVFSEKTGFNVDNFLEVFAAADKVKAREILEKCADKNEQKSTPIEWMKRGLACIKSNNLAPLLDMETAQERMGQMLTFPLFTESSEESTESKE